MFSSRKARNKRSFTTVQIVSGQLLSATVNPEQPVDISRILAAANKRCSAYCQRLPKGSATMPALAGMIYNIQLIRFTIYTIPFSISEIMLPEYSASSSASIMPPLIFMPFHLVQNTLDHLIGLSSARSAPALVRYPCSSASPKEIRSFSSKLFPVHFLYLSFNFENA